MELTGRHQKWKSSLSSSYASVFPSSSVEASEYERRNLVINSSANNVMLNTVQKLTHRTDRVSLLDETMHIHGNSLSELLTRGRFSVGHGVIPGNWPPWTNFYSKRKRKGLELIFAQMTTMLDLLETYLRARQHKFVRLDGSTKVSDRAAVVSGFQSDESIFVFMLSTRAGGLGINLTAADTVVFFESDWNPTVDQQAMDRAHRLGQTRTVHVYRLICRNTVEEYIAKTAKEKEQVTDLVLKGSNKKKEEESIERVKSFDEINDAQTTEISKAEALKMLLDDAGRGGRTHERAKSENGSQDPKSRGNHSSEERRRRKRRRSKSGRSGSCNINLN